MTITIQQRVTQTRLHTESVNGNCMAACFATVLGGEISDYDAVIDPLLGANWWLAVERMFIARGILILRISTGLAEFAGAPSQLCFASGVSPRGVRHLCVMDDGEIVHDPHPSRSGLVEITDYWILVPWKAETIGTAA